MHPDASSELDYITRANPENKPKLYRKNEMVGEIGWSMPSQKTGRPRDIEGNYHGFKRGEFRDAAQAAHTHLYQASDWLRPHLDQFGAILNNLFT